ncbi:hypothetical protein [Sphingomonas sp. TDK1]|uniref:hypothetical protein n=1 Tax=Sphingomonas sp. TDK1 TaxID=453247 RepID=UPI001E368611|nr:hypothetical protein [Sphingomonas sp. TDK1]
MIVEGQHDQAMNKGPTSHGMRGSVAGCRRQRIVAQDDIVYRTYMFAIFITEKYPASKLYTIITGATRTQFRARFSSPVENTRFSVMTGYKPAAHHSA